MRTLAKPYVYTRSSTITHRTVKIVSVNTPVNDALTPTRYITCLNLTLDTTKITQTLDFLAIKIDNTPPMALQTFTMTLKWAEMIAPTVRHLAFERTDGETFVWTPGQFITIHFEVDGKLLRRSYSVASVPGKTNLIEFAAGHFAGGPGTELLFKLQPGDTLTASGPAGRLVLRDETPKRYVFVATSTEVTPYRSMLPGLAARQAGGDLKVVILLGVQHREDLIYGEEFLEFANAHPTTEFRAHYSREKSAELRSHETLGYVQSAFDELDLDPENDIVYLCGNPGMIDEAFTQLKDAGFSPQNVRREKYISSK